MSGLKTLNYLNALEPLGSDLASLDSECTTSHAPCLDRVCPAKIFLALILQNLLILPYSSSWCLE